MIFLLGSNCHLLTKEMGPIATIWQQFALVRPIIARRRTIVVLFNRKGGSDDDEQGKGTELSEDNGKELGKYREFHHYTG